jgi:hypothetical protein
MTFVSRRNTKSGHFGAQILYNYPLSMFEGESRLMAELFVLSLWQAWEGRAYEYGLKNLHLMGYPVHGLSFDNDLVDSHSLIPNQFHRTSPNV